MTAPSDIEVALLAKHKAEHQAALWLKPLLSDREIAEACGIPYSSWCALKKKGKAPPLFQLGRRLFAHTSDVRAWLCTLPKLEPASEAKAA